MLRRYEAMCTDLQGLQCMEFLRSSRECDRISQLDTQLTHLLQLQGLPCAGKSASGVCVCVCNAATLGEHDIAGLA